MTNKKKEPETELSLSEAQPKEQPELKEEKRFPSSSEDEISPSPETKEVADQPVSRGSALDWSDSEDDAKPVAAPLKAPEPLKTSGLAFDDFDDFEESPAITPTASTFDDFDEFEDTPSTPIQPVVNGDLDDDFDFDFSPKAIQSPPEPTQTPASGTQPPATETPIQTPQVSSTPQPLSFQPVPPVLNDTPWLFSGSQSTIQSSLSEAINSSFILESAPSQDTDQPLEDLNTK